MKRLVIRPIKDERGAALLLVLILLLVGGLIIPPLLSYMGSGLIAGQMYEKRTEELYAADSGVEYALYQIITKADDLPQAVAQTTTYSIRLSKKRIL